MHRNYEQISLHFRTESVKPSHGQSVSATRGAFLPTSLTILHLSNKPMRLLTTLTFALVGTAAPLSAQALATWEMDNHGVPDTGNPGYAFSTADRAFGVDSAILTLPGTETSFTSPTAPVTEAVFPDTYGFSALRTDNFQDAIDNGHYFEFTLGAAPGYSLNLTSIDVNFVNGANGGSFPDRFTGGAILTSLDGFTAPVATDDAADVGLFTSQVSLSGPQFNAVNFITFRIAVFGETTVTTGDGGRVRMRSGVDGPGLRVNGTAVPEISSTLPLGMLLGLAIFGFRKRRS